MAKLQTISRNASPQKARTTLCNALLQSSRMSLEAVGLVSSMISRDVHWNFVREWAKSEFRVGDDKLDRILREARDAKFCWLYKEKTADGKFSGLSIHFFTDEPGVFEIYDPVAAAAYAAHVETENRKSPLTEDGTENRENRKPGKPENGKPRTIKRKDSVERKESSETEASLRSASTTAPDGAVVDEPICEEPFSDFQEVAETEIIRPAGKPKPGPKQGSMPVVTSLGQGAPAVPALIQRATDILNAWPSGPGKRKVMQPDTVHAQIGLLLQPYKHEDPALVERALDQALAAVAVQGLDGDDVRMKGPRGALKYLMATLKATIHQMKIDAEKLGGVVDRQKEFLANARKTGPRPSTAELNDELERNGDIYVRQ